MLQVLSCTDVKDSQECAFLGESGRYVVLSGLRALAIWDLVSGNGSCPFIPNCASDFRLKKCSYQVAPRLPLADTTHYLTSLY